MKVCLRGHKAPAMLSNSFSFGLSAVTAEGDAPQTVDVELSCSGLTELDLGADEVFIVSPAACPSRLPVYPYAVRTCWMLTIIPTEPYENSTHPERLSRTCPTVTDVNVFWGGGWFI